eukprot:TRINITY_DN40163_c0_g1_i1.p1 TRINITY_DN40163_c0_g1~~TRINITY_DN40163_c0_g1_i1.p1  ORF type:complete len:216 (+),score=35.69 TRINITY_DN40163_c0_g1_i1:147-794(+)
MVAADVEASPSAGGAGKGPCETQRFFLRGIEKLGEHHLRDYFQKYGELTEVTLVRDKKTQRPRGMGFITIAPPLTDGDSLSAFVDRVIEDSHTINSVDVELQEAMPKLEDEKKSGESQTGLASEPVDLEPPGAPAVVEEQADPAAQASAQAQMQMHYLAMAINACVPDLASMPGPPPMHRGYGPAGGTGVGKRPTPYPAGVQPKASASGPIRGRS